MPIPFILGGVALAAGAFGAKKAYDGYCDQEEANRINYEAEEIYENAEARLIEARDKCNASLEKLGTTKIEIFTNSIKRWKSISDKIKNKPMSELSDDIEQLSLSEEELLELEKTIITFTELAGGGITSLGAGALAGIGAYGSVGLLASASTGTAISALSGAAATNATLAWLGGGSLAAGGFGMAGGMAVLGGIVAGPVLALGGFMYAKKGEEALNNAYSNRYEARAKAEELDTAGVGIKGITRIINQAIKEINRLNDLFIPIIDELEELVETKTDYKKFSKEQIELYRLNSNFAKSIYEICKVNVLGADGAVTQEIKQAIKTAKSFRENIVNV